MSSTNKLVIVIAIILIIVCLIAGKNKNQEVDIINQENGQQVKEVTYNTVTNETTGEEEYVVYDKDTGREITRVQDEHQLKIYEINPNYEELPVESQEYQMDEEIITE